MPSACMTSRELGPWLSIGFTAACCWLSVVLLLYATSPGTTPTGIVPAPSFSRAVPAECSTARASACGDPHFQGFDGTPFDFQGHVGGFYNLISEQRHQVNAKFVSDPVKPADSGTWIGELAIKYKDDVILIKTAGMGRLSVLVNNRPFTASTPGGVSRQALPSAMRLSFRQRSASDSNSDERIILVTPSLSLAVRVPGPQYRHLDLLILAVSPFLCDVHGALGQTYKRMYTKGEAASSTPFTFEGAGWDYELPGLLSDSFTFNRFKLLPGGGCVGSSAESIPAGAEFGREAPEGLGLGPAQADVNKLGQKSAAV